MSAFSSLRDECPKILPLFLPILVSQYAAIASGVIDAAMAGNLGTEELASIAVGVAVWVPFQAFLLGMLYGLLILVSQACGAGDDLKIRMTTQQGLYTGLLFGLAGAGSLYFISSYIGEFGIEEPIAGHAAQYIRAEAWGLPFACLMFVLRFYCEGQKIVMPVTVVAVLCIGFKALFNFMFIYGELGAPELGVVGCGIATVATNICFMCMMAGYICLTPNFAGKRLFSSFHAPNFRSIWRIFKTGLPIGLCFTSEFLVFSVIMLFISRGGAVSAAAHQIAFNCVILFFSSAAAFSGAACIRVGILFGAGDADNLRRATSGIIALSALLGTLLLILMVANGELLARTFSNDMAVIPLAVALLHIAAFFQIVDSMQVCLSGILRGIGDIYVPFLYTTSGYWLVGIPLGYALSGMPLLFGLDLPVTYGVRGWWMALTVALFLACLSLSFRVRRKIFCDAIVTAPAQNLEAG